MYKQGKKYYDNNTILLKIRVSKNIIESTAQIYENPKKLIKNLAKRKKILIL